MLTANMKLVKSTIEHVAVRKREPLMLWGQPGAGKSEGVAQLAAKYNGELVDIRLSQYDSVDLRGIPVPVGTELTYWVPPSTLPFKGNKNFDETRLCFLFLDEITSASQAVQAASYQLINDGGVGEHKLHDNVIIIAAGNRDGDRGATNRMPTPLANRFTHIELGVDVESFSEYAASKGMSPVGIAFLNFRKPLITTFDPSSPAKAFATPRTWSKALDYFADEEMPADVRRASMVGAVGEGPATELLGFAEVWQSLPRIKDIVADPRGIPVSDDLATRYAVAVAISGSMSLTTVTPLHTYLKRLSPEFLILAWKLALSRDASLYEADEYMELAEKYKAVFTA